MEVQLKSYTQRYGHSAECFICYRCEGMSGKEIQSAATSSFTGCDGCVESSNAAVLGVLGYLQPPGQHTWLCPVEELRLLARRLEAGLATLGCTCCSPAPPRLVPHSTHVSLLRRARLLSFEADGKESGCMRLLHFCTGSEEWYFRA